MQHYRELTFEESLPVANDESKERNDSGRNPQEVKFLSFFFNFRDDVFPARVYPDFIR
jgi:hypothetical protein